MDKNFDEHGTEYVPCKTQEVSESDMAPEKLEDRGPYAQILKFFSYKHLPAHLQEISKDFSELAHQMACRGGDIAETKAGIRKILEAKDCAVRSMID